MASLFETYEREYLSSTRTAAQNIEQIPELLPGHAREEMVSKTATAIQSAEEVVQQMELEARSVQGEERRQLTAQAKDYKASIGALKEQLKAAKNSHKTEELARAELLRNTDQASSDGLERAAGPSMTGALTVSPASVVEPSPHSLSPALSLRPGSPRSGASWRGGDAARAIAGVDRAVAARHR